MGRYRIWGTLVALIVAYLFFRHFAVAEVHLVWLKHLGYPVLFWKPVLSELYTGVAGGLVFAVATYLNLRVALPAISARQRLGPNVVGLGLERRTTMPRAVSLWLAIAVGLLAGWIFSTQWPTVQYFVHATPFKQVDPQFGRNVGFFVFTLPFLHMLYTSFGLLLWLAGLSALAIYWGAGWLTAMDGRLQVHPGARLHLGIVVAAYLTLKAIGYRLDAWNLDYSSRGISFGAGWVDVHVSLPVLWVLSVVALLAAAAATTSALGGSLRWMGWGVAGLAGISVVFGSLLPTVMENLVVKPSQYALEKPYILRNITMTRTAFGLSGINLQSFPVETNLNSTDLTNYRATFRNIRLWDGSIASPAFQQLQGLRSYYSFDPMRVDRYTVNGEYRQVLIAPREIDYNALPNETWVNRHLVYTHGYGVVIIPSSQIGPEGVPNFWMQNINDTSTVGLTLKEPSIYYGLQSNVYAIVDGKKPAFDYPSGSQDVYTQYKGTGGIPIGGFWSRLAFSLWANSYNPMLTNDIAPNTRAMIYRSINQRLPEMVGGAFLQYGTHPYAVIANGQLYWMVNGYTESQYYPYSTPTSGGVNYLRNSVKITVNAYTGKVRFYAVDPTDPILQTIEKIFPGVIQPIQDMPAALQQHLRYAKDLFTMQAQMYATYHMTDPEVFYNHEDQWSVAQQIIGQTPSAVKPYYVVMQFPNIKTPQFVLMEPFTPISTGSGARDNMVSWMAAFSDGSRYGQVVAYEFPKGQQVYGPLQIEAQINQDPTVADILTLWSQGGATVYRGNMLTIPIRDSFIYVEPLYEEATATQLPALRRVVVDYNGQQIAVGDSLDQALVQIFGKLPWSSLNAGQITGTTVATGSSQSSGSPPTTGSTSGASALSQELHEAQALFAQAEAALKQGNFASYGQSIAALGKLLGGGSSSSSTASSSTSSTSGVGAGLGSGTGTGAAG